MNNLEKIKSKKKKEEIMKILTGYHPAHNQRLWLVGFLKFVGYTPEEICNIIAKYNTWKDYDPMYTKKQVYSVFTRKKNV